MLSHTGSPEGRGSTSEIGPLWVGLRIDVCTYQGCDKGVPALLDVLARRGLRATFFVAMGPDRSGLAILRIFTKRGFLKKMFRTGAASMYGLRTALYGTLLPAPVISARCAPVLQRAAKEGHEVGIHSWNHVAWQDGLDRLSCEAIAIDYKRAIESYRRIVGQDPPCTGAPAWLSSDVSLEAGDAQGFHYASDCRGRGPFLPKVRGRTLRTFQVPITLPTLDEVLGREGRTPEGFNELILESLTPGAANVHTAHAEAEGRKYLAYFEQLLDRLDAAGWKVLTLGDLLSRQPRPLPACSVDRGTVAGRAGEVSIQGPPLKAETS
jgi:peptidoglycan/xylan/chitin deacetylase (PgdA/CDA1 family)